MMPVTNHSLTNLRCVRFQTTFLPVEEGEKQALEFAPEAYNYSTKDDEDPRNLILLCTTQGLAIQQDGKGGVKLFHHSSANGTIQRRPSQPRIKLEVPRSRLLRKRKTQ